MFLPHGIYKLNFNASLWAHILIKAGAETFWTSFLSKKFAVSTVLLENIKNILKLKKCYAPFKVIGFISSVRKNLVFWLGSSYKWTSQQIGPLNLKPEELSFTFSTLDGDKHLVWSDGAMDGSLCLPLMKLTMRFLNVVKPLQTLSRYFLLVLSGFPGLAWRSRTPAPSPEATSPLSQSSARS